MSTSCKITQSFLQKEREKGTTLKSTRDNRNKDFNVQNKEYSE